MAGFEDLIRRTLDQQGTGDAAGRQKIYASSRQALERMLGQNPDMAAAQMDAQRQRLETAIASIESEFAPPKPVAVPQPPVSAASAPQPVAPPKDPPPAPVVSPTPPPVVASAPRPQPVAASAPQVAAKPKPVPPPMPRLREDPVVETPRVDLPLPGSVGQERVDQSPVAPLAPERPVGDYTSEYRDDLLTKRKPYAKLLLWTIVIVGLAVCVWWAITFGPALLKRQFDGSVPNPAQTIESGSFVPGGGDGWLTAFLPGEDSQNVDTEGRGTADLFQNADSTFLRMASNAGSTANTIRIKVPRGIMQAVRGKVATFEMTMRGPEGDGHQFAVFCEFGPLGECGRKRFRIRDKVEAFVFDVLVNDVALPTNQDAYLVVNTDLSSSGKPVDLLAIRARTGQ